MRTALMLAAVMAPGLVWAGGSAEMQSTGNGGKPAVVSIEYRADGRIRMSVPEQKDGYMLVRDGRAYMVSQADGQTMVMDLSQMMAMAGGMMQQHGADTPATGDIARFESMQSTGRSETVAGVQGAVHMLTFVDDEGRRRTEEVVLSNDARARAFTQALFGFSATLAGAQGKEALEGTQAFTDQLQTKGQGVLRFGDQMRVTRLDGARPPDARFELPAPPMQMPSFGGMGKVPGAAAGDGFGQRQAQRQQQRAEDQVEGEVDQAADEAVDKALDKAFRKLLRR